MMRRLRFLLPVLLLLLAAVALVSCGDEASQKLVRTDGGVELKLNADGSSYSAVGLWKTDATDVDIPYQYNDIPVTSIAAFAFNNCDSLVNVRIADGVRYIDEHAFDHCSNLMGVRLPDSMRGIGAYAFANCEMLNYVGIECFSELSTIEDSAFENCASLHSFRVPDNLKSIGKNAFTGCGRLVEVYDLSEYVTVVQGEYEENGGIGAHAVVIRTEEVESGITLDDNGYFFFVCEKGSYLLDYIGFSNRLTLPTTCNGKSYGILPYAFYNKSSIQSVILPTAVTDIRERAFEGCTSLETVYYAGSQDNWRYVRIGERNTELTSAKRYYYSSLPPTTIGSFWRYENGLLTVW